MTATTIRPRILVAEQDSETREFLCRHLTADGYIVRAVSTHDQAIDALDARPYAAIVADLNGATLRLVDTYHPRQPIIVLARDSDEVSVVRSLEHGADGVISKPLSYPMLHARLKAILRRARIAPVTLTPHPDLVVDTVSREVRVRGKGVTLTATQYALLAHLASDPERVFTKRELVQALWDAKNIGSSRTLDSHACRLRLKLGEPFVVNVWGVGYSLLRGQEARR